MWGESCDSDGSSDLWPVGRAVTMGTNWGVTSCGSSRGRGVEVSELRETSTVDSKE